MLRSLRISRLSRAVAVAVVLLAVVSIIALRGYASRHLSGSGSGGGRQVKLKLVRVDNGKVIKVTQFTGLMITVGFEGKRQYGLVPNVEERTGNVSVVLHEIAQIEGDNIRLAKELETMQLDASSIRYSSVSDLPFGVILDNGNETPAPTRPDGTLQGFRSGNLTAPPALRTVAYHSAGTSLYALQGSNRCCVTCDGVQTCACSVEADCGSCCAPKCCDLGG